MISTNFIKEIKLSTLRTELIISQNNISPGFPNSEVDNINYQDAQAQMWEMVLTHILTHVLHQVIKFFNSITELSLSSVYLYPFIHSLLSSSLLVSYINTSFAAIHFPHSTTKMWISSPMLKTKQNKQANQLIWLLFICHIKSKLFLIA